MEYLCDEKRHLICVPYSVDNLHAMAEALGIKRCWFRAGGRNYHPHYDIPARRVDEIKGKCRVTTDREIFRIIKDNTTES